MSRISIRSIHPSGLHRFATGKLSLTNLRDDVNVIYAPNASGKSTLAKAIRLLFQPDKKELAAAWISGTLAVDGVEQAERRVSAGDARYPGIPERAEDYVLDIIKLVQGLDEKDEFNYLVKLLGDGVVSVSKKLPEIRGQDLKQLNEARKALDDVRRKSAELSKRIADLRDLEDRVAESKLAGKKLEALKNLKKIQDNHTEQSRLLAALDQLELQHPGILLQTEVLEAAIDREWKTLPDLERELRAIDAQLKTLSPKSPEPKRPFHEVDLESLDKLREAADRLNRDIQRVIGNERKHAEQVDRSRRGIEALLGKVPDEALPLLNLEKIEDFLRIARDADEERKVGAQVDGYKRAVAAIANGLPPEPVSDPQIREWLQLLEPKPVVTSGPPMDRRVGLLMILVVAASVACAVLPDLTMRLAVVFLAVILAVAVFLGLRPKDEAGPLAIAQSPEQSRELILSTISKLEAAYKVKATHEAKRTIELLASNVDYSPSWPEQAKRLGFDVDSRDPYLLAPIFSNLENYRKASLELATTRAELAGYRQEMSDIERQVSAIFGEYGFDHGNRDSLHGVDSFDEWRNAVARFSEKKTALDRSIRVVDSGLDAAGIPASDDRAQRVGWLDSRREVAADYRKKASNLSFLSKDDEPSYEDQDALRDFGAEELMPEHLPELIDAYSEVHDLLQERADAFAELRTQIEVDANSEELADKEKRYLEAVKAVHFSYAKRSVEVAAFRIGEHLSEVMRTRDLPHILESANRWIEKFTKGRYQFVLGKSPTEPVILRDNDHGIEQPFGQLSTGTKVHVMLGIRLGLIEEHERNANGNKFPLITDETTAVSDPVSTMEIAEALVEISKERQVIFFTNKPADVNLMRSLVPGLEVKTLGSGEVPFVDSDSSELPVSRSVGPERFDIMLPIRSNRPSVVLPDSRLTGGSFDHFLDMGKAYARELVMRLEEIQAEIIAQHPRLRWEEVSQQDWLSDTFADRVKAVVDGCAGSVPAFEQGLEGIQRFGSKKRDARLWLEEAGYLNPPTPDYVRELVARRLGSSVSETEVDHFVNLFLSVY